ncbi:periplasmic heavy metal sensor [Pseudooceanicola sp. LIPI14-2-Ac024]|uniref:periplasmic heavy metal sensor n=1 Tax=Pseudooceanicola sp. LIPI14-2-Ac024 TaxID=3344875 RepID=UPI0035CF658B
MNDTPPTPTPAAAPTRLWVRILLVASLALNLLVIVTVVSFAAFHGGPDGKHRPPRVDRTGGPLTGALSESDKREIGRAIWQSYREGRPSRADVQAEYQEVIRTLRTEPYDPSAVEASLQKQLDFAVERQAVGQQMLLDRLAAMTPEERAAFADRLEEGLSRGPKRDKD